MPTDKTNPTTPRASAAKPAKANTRRAGTPNSQTAGNGGETHQTASRMEDTLTTNQGIPVSDNQNQLKAGPRGPVLLEDFVFREKIFHFDHERIPERIVHARGSAAHGFFELYESLADITKADLFQRPGERPRCSPGSPPWPAAPARSTRRATCAASR